MLHSKSLHLKHNTNGFPYERKSYPGSCGDHHCLGPGYVCAPRLHQQSRPSHRRQDSRSLSKTRRRHPPRHARSCEQGPRLDRIIAKRWLQTLSSFRDGSNQTSSFMRPIPQKDLASLMTKTALCLSGCHFSANTRQRVL